MSRKDLLGVSANVPTVPHDGQAKNRAMPLLGVARKDRDPATKLTANIGNALHEQNDRLGRAEEIERRLAEGQAVIDMNPAEIDPSFVQDRMPGDIDGLVESIREQGQQVPILVRPHPAQPGRYQVAFGHRRLRAVTELGLWVKAIVRDLTDEQLVVAQGQENNQRQDLTYIEKARFADRLKAQFSREVIMSAMSLHKGDVSIMLSVISRLTGDLIDAIGPAPGVGRRSWSDLADFLEKNDKFGEATEFVLSDEIRVLPSDERFKTLLAYLKPRSKRADPDVWTTSAGVPLAKVTRVNVKLDISIDTRKAPEFAAFVLEHLTALFEEHRSKSSAKDQQNNGE
ncbi:plasmid partitioning protein RepB (plasmid) [Rhizobium sp. RCAM05350]|uniref:plasmid partitioning protein RepB n=1 Tax=Rhizobium sp. RCAM05350 TaxID=2895568 RepID=UPI002076A665|nr:plasmid partitioning protein RepB [Rhizobium sp. RCAM05350]URK89520.1 plasmid partitioning protein RepB [Rhizobium sp. RCAM05350]